MPKIGRCLSRSEKGQIPPIALLFLVVAVLIILLAVVGPSLIQPSEEHMETENHFFETLIDDPCGQGIQNMYKLMNEVEGVSSNAVDIVA
ncbi:MAG: hypothetical protein KAW09_02075, partial [Thermoplasmata archaeon]|nr:hypothetical protein [Thermoplasmata archaeon]